MVLVGFGRCGTGGGCTALHYALAGGWYILITGSDGAPKDCVPPARARWVTMGLYDSDSQPIRTRIEGSEYGGARVHVSEIAELTQEYARIADARTGGAPVSLSASYRSL